jgi:hypothetical protein
MLISKSVYIGLWNTWKSSIMALCKLGDLWPTHEVFELHDELRTFLISQNHEYATLLSDESWVAKLAYISDIFTHLNKPNRKMQSKDETIFSTMDKIEGFGGKLKLWL